MKQASGALFGALVSFALLLVLARVLGPAAFGSYVWLLGLAVLGLLLIEGGWPTRVYRHTVDAPAVEAQGTVGAATPHAVAWLLVSAALLAALAALLGGRAAFAAFACMLPVALANLVSARLRGAGRFGTEAAWQAAARATSALAILAAVGWLAADATTVFAAWALGLSLPLLLWGRRWLRAPRWRGFVAAQRGVLPFLAIDGALVVLLRADIALAGLFEAAPLALAHYAACTRFTEAGVLLFAPVTNVLLRTLRERRDDAQTFRRALRDALAAALLIGGGATVAAAIAGDRVVQLAFGADYVAAGALLPWVAATLAPMLATLVLVQGANAAGHERAAARRVACGALLLPATLAVGYALDGLRGLALALAVTHLVVCAALWPLAWRSASR